MFVNVGDKIINTKCIIVLEKIDHEDIYYIQIGLEHCAITEQFSSKVERNIKFDELREELT